MLKYSGLTLFDFTNNIEDKSLSLAQKIKRAEDMLIKAYKDNNGMLFISFSGGKDSTILRHIALRLFPDLKVVFSNTTNELSEILKYIKTFKEVITVIPKMNFTQVVKKYGFPLVSKEVSQKVNELKRTHGKKTRLKRFQGDSKGNGKLSNKWRYLAEQDFNVSQKCCEVLKKNPLEKWAKENNLKPIIALMSGESKLREQLALYGKDDGNKIYPFLKTGWTDKDIWEYAQLYNIRFAECYYDRVINNTLVKARTRTGCEFCGFGITLEKEDRFKRSKITSPKKYEKMMKITNNGVTLEDAIGLVKSKNNKPLIDLYGVKLSSVITYNKKELPDKLYDMQSTTLVKKCPHCNSKNIKNNFGHIGMYHDTPDSFTKETRKILINSKYGYDCYDCKLPIVDDLHMFNMEFGITNRLHEYIELNMNKKPLAEIISETGLNFDLACSISIKIYKKIKLKEAA